MTMSPMPHWGGYQAEAPPQSPTVTLSYPDARLVANVLERDVEQIVNGERPEPAPAGALRLEIIVAELRGKR
jgi:hypothetical protein